MQRLNNPFLYLTSSLILGIILDTYLQFPPWIGFALIGITLILYGWLMRRNTTRFLRTTGIIPAILILFTTIGITVHAIHQPTHDPKHFTHQLNRSPSESHLLQIELLEKLQPTKKFMRFIAAVHTLDNQFSRGKILLHVPRPTATAFQTGTFYALNSILTPIQGTKNPGQFNYAQQLARRGILAQTMTTPLQLKPEHQNVRSWRMTLGQLRQKLALLLRSDAFEPREQGVLNALVLGQRQDLDRTTREDYARAGVIHILAISGLHLGILYAIIQMLLFPLRRLRHGHTIQTLLCLFFIWSFAVFTGATPSVLRAATMFTFLAIGKWHHARSSIIRSLLVSAFVLLCFDPSLLFEVGFQLSYAALFGIVAFHPLTNKLFNTNLLPLRVLWDTARVSCAAQLAVWPLVLYYFHQFPGAFLLSNLILLPLIGFLLGFGVLILVLGLLFHPPIVLINILNALLTAMNDWIHWVGSLDVLFLSDIPFSKAQMTSAYLLLVTLVLWMHFKSKKYRNAAITGSITLLISSLWTNYRHLYSEQLIVFHDRYNTVIAHRSGHQLRVYPSKPIHPWSINNYIKPFMVEHAINNFSLEQPVFAFHFAKKNIARIDRSGDFLPNLLCPDIVILSEGPKVHPQRLLEHWQPKMIIAAAQNPEDDLQLWEKHCKDAGIDFYRVDLLGALEL